MIRYAAEMGRRHWYFLVTLCIILFSIIYLGLQEIDDGTDADHADFRSHEGGAPSKMKWPEEISVPIILWWNPLTQERGRVKMCGEHKCFFTVNRSYRHHPKMKVFIFYATDFDFGDLPLPRCHDWALLHEESPKNKYLFSHADAMTLFNHTSTFKRESDNPLTTQYLETVEFLESKKFLVPTTEKNRLMRDEDLALVNYVFSDCDAPSDRDRIVEMLERRVRVDSYGKCRHNKHLHKNLRDPLKGMAHENFYRLLAKYKFTLATENAVCDDYITEKFWRPIHVGSVPIVFGSPKIKDFLPSEKSAIVVNDFTNIDEIVELMLRLNSSDVEYDEYLAFKTEGVTNTHLKNTMASRKWGVNNPRDRPNFIDSFECLVCERIHEQLQREQLNQEPVKFQATVEHYGCPKPLRFSDSPPGDLRLVADEEFWATAEWTSNIYHATALQNLIAQNRTFNRQEVYDLSMELRSREDSRLHW